MSKEKAPKFKPTAEQKEKLASRESSDSFSKVEAYYANIDNPKITEYGNIIAILKGMIGKSESEIKKEIEKFQKKLENEMKGPKPLDYLHKDAAIEDRFRKNNK